mmetsp:Transcript_4849/g.11567  ORF Transcript_4849/g.11567 Transcript_4849/m.11567 type:complete len:145 (+) Transcript_4849:609-1043(+)
MLVASVESLGGVQRVTEAETKIRHRSENRQQTTSPSHPDPTISPSQPVVSKALPENLNSNLLSVSISKKPSILKSNDPSASEQPTSHSRRFRLTPSQIQPSIPRNSALFTLRQESTTHRMSNFGAHQRTIQKLAFLIIIILVCI